MHTVPSFLESYLIPCCLTEVAPATVGYYRIAARKFAAWAGNPPLRAITNAMLAQYREALRRMPARGKGDKPLSINTVHSLLSMLQSILDKAGPPVRRSRDAAGYLAVVPWVKLPREEFGEATIVSEETIAACYAEAESMRWPAENAAAFWRAILIVGRHLGLRARTMRSMEWRHVEWEHRRLRLPGTILKGRKMLVLPLPQVVVEHLEPIRRDEGRIFDWPHSDEFFRRAFHQLQTKAGVERFGLHALRRTAITRLWAKSPAATQLLAGHSSPIITRMSYVNVEEVLAAAMRDGGEA